MVHRTPDRLTAPRLVLVDDHAMVLEAMAESLRGEFTISGTAANGAALLAHLSHHVVDCVLLDVQLSDRNGLDLIPAIRRARPEVRIVVVSMMSDRRIADAALQAGASAYVPKDAPISELRTAIREALAGRRYVSSRVPKSSHRVSLGAEHVGLNRLTPRQQQIVLLLGEGRHCSEIAHRLAVQPSTITFHKQNIMRILGVDGDAALLRFAVLLRAGTGEGVIA